MSAMGSKQSSPSSRSSKPSKRSEGFTAAAPETSAAALKTRQRGGNVASAPPTSKAPKPAEYTGPLVPKSAKTGKLLQSKESYKGQVLSVWTDTVLEPGATKPYTRDVVRHNGSVVVLAVDDRTNPHDPLVILIRQYRHAAGQYLLELPAGRIDVGEKPLAAAKREMIEETGYRAKRWTPLARYFASPGFLCEWMQIFLAEDLTEGEATPEEDERIELNSMPLSKALAMAAAGQIHDGKTLIGLLVLDAKRRQKNTDEKESFPANTR